MRAAYLTSLFIFGLYNKKEMVKKKSCDFVWDLSWFWNIILGEYNKYKVDWTLSFILSKNGSELHGKIRVWRHYSVLPYKSKSSA